MGGTLSERDVRRLLERGRIYRSKAVVRAVRAAEDSDWTTGQGDVLHATAGDWWIIDGDDRWSVAADVFNETYTHVEGDQFRKDSAVVAVAVNEPFSVQTLEGPATGSPGDWLVQNPSGEYWPVPADVFARRYEEA